jgi:uncharacterized damage-inducible protein DinB
VDFRLARLANCKYRENFCAKIQTRVPNLMDEKQLIETWAINNRINLYLLDAIQEENLNDSLTSKGRSAGEQFAHIHNVRLMWLKAAQPELLKDREKIEKENAHDKKLLQRSLTVSGEAIEKLLETAIQNGGKVKGFKPHVTAFVGYLTAHDAHHRSQAIIALKQSGHKLDQKILYGIWEWGAR